MFFAMALRLPGFGATMFLIVRGRLEVRLFLARFRKKDPSWTVFSLEMLFENGDRRSWCTVDDYYLRAFLGDYITQNACHSCLYTGTDRLSDITLADFWGYVSESRADRNTEDGISLVLVNSDAGMGLLKSVDGVHLIDKELGEAVKGNPPLRTVFPANGRSDEFWADYEKGGFDSVLTSIWDRVLLVKSISLVSGSMIMPISSRVAAPRIGKREGWKIARWLFAYGTCIVSV